MPKIRSRLATPRPNIQEKDKIMSVHFGHVLLALFFLSSFSVVGKAQPESSGVSRAIVYTTTPKKFFAKLKSDTQEVYEIDGLLSFTIIEAKPDDTILGTLIYSLPDHALQKIAALT